MLYISLVKNEIYQIGPTYVERHDVKMKYTS